MKGLQIIFLLCMILVFNNVFSQNNRSRAKTTDEIEKNENATEIGKANQKVDDANNEINSANTSFNESLDASKETVNGVKETFNSIFGKGDKKKKGKQMVSINIPNIEYDDENLSLLYDHAEKVKGVKNPSKTYKNGNVLIEFIYKKGADALYQNIPKEVRKAFKLIEITETAIYLEPIKK